MNFLDYIKGNRKGTEAHRIEKDSMKDPFMYEAMEGFDSVDDNHIERIKQLQERLNIRTKKKRHRPVWQITAAACAAVVAFAIGGYFFDGNHKTELYTQSMNNETEAIIKIYIPENYYVENVVTIAKHNVEAVKAYTPSISKFKPNENNVTEEEVKSLSESEEVLDVYLPE